MLLLALMLGFITCGIVACGDDDDDVKPGTEQMGDDGKDDDTPNAPQQEKIVVTVDANGNAQGDHRFIAIDDSNFIIDDIKYTAQNGNLYVSGYDETYFRGRANLIDALDYQGHHLVLKGITYKAFDSCKLLTSITIPSSVIEIESYAFSNCTGLTSITIPKGVTSIGDNIFHGCTRLISVTLHCLYVHFGLSGLPVQEVVVGNEVTKIAEGVFNDCKALNSIKVEKGNEIYDSRNNCNAIIMTETNQLMVGCSQTIIPDNVTSIGNYAFHGCTGLTSITIPESVTSIGNYAFHGCTGLTSITIPAGVTSIGNDVFGNCRALISIKVEEGNEIYDSRKNCNAIIMTETNKLMVGCSQTIIPDNVTSIGDCAFFGCLDLTSITIPAGVTNIGDFAFYGCTGLTSIAIPEGVTDIGDYAFSDCTSMASITIPNSITSFGFSAFEGCRVLIDVYCYAEEVPDIYYKSLFSKVDLSAVTLHVPAVSIDAYKSAWPWNVFGSIVAIE